MSAWIESLVPDAAAIATIVAITGPSDRVSKEVWLHGAMYTYWAKLSQAIAEVAAAGSCGRAAPGWPIGPATCKRKTGFLMPSTLHGSQAKS